MRIHSLLAAESRMTAPDMRTGVIRRDECQPGTPQQVEGARRVRVASRSSGNLFLCPAAKSARR